MGSKTKIEDRNKHCLDCGQRIPPEELLMIEVGWEYCESCWAKRCDECGKKVLLSREGMCQECMCAYVGFVEDE